MAVCGVTIFSENLSGLTTNVTFYPCSGGTISLGDQVFPFNYVDDYYFGQFDCYVPLYDYNYILEIPCPPPTYELIPTGELLYDIIPLDNLSALDIPNGELLYDIIPLDNLSALDIPNGELLYETIPLDNLSALDIPNGDLLYAIIKN
jgi:hypothetical protein